MIESNCSPRAGLRERAERARRAQGIIGSAPAFLDVLDQLACFAAVDVPIYISGETGTGKELAARTVHYLSARSKGPFIAINCGALPDRLFENELFGHDRGAFTDARDAQRGLIAQAEGGTLLLDEIDSLDPHSQAALLRFVQDKSYRQLGAGRDRIADVRIIASSNSVLEERVAEGRFRHDLLFRLDVARAELPPLRHRQVDILPLARHFLAKAAAHHGLPVPRIGPDLAQRLTDYAWPGNVRELENAMQRALLLADGAGELGADLRLGGTRLMFPAAVQECYGPATGFSGSLKSARERHNSKFEREYLTWLLQRSEGNITAASQEAETERRHLGRMIHRHGIDPRAFKRKDDVEPQ